MVSIDMTLCTHHMMSPDLKCMDDSCEFKIMGRIVLLMSPECSRCISNHLVVLQKHTTKSDSRSITIDVKRFGNIRLSQNWGSSEMCSESVECIFAFLIPGEFNSFL
jgi:hypothetical protein